MKNFENPHLDTKVLKSELKEFKDLLIARLELNERNDILTFFQQRRHLSTYIGTFVPNMKYFDRIAFEYELYGDFSADLVVGDSKSKIYLFIEFEAGTNKALFRKKGKKATPEWSPNFERGFSQIVDWFWALDGYRYTPDFRSTFGSSEAKIFAMLVCGRDSVLGPAEQQRLEWREDKVVVNSNRIFCLTYDELSQELSERVEYESNHWKST